MSATTRPLPRIHPEAAPFWQAARERRLLLQQCSRCRRYQHYPRLLCRHCHSRDLSWQDASGKGSIYSFSVVYRSPGGFSDDVPYVTAVVELDEGARMFSRIIACDPEKVEIGMRVEASYERQTDELTFVMFKPARAN